MSTWVPIAVVAAVQIGLRLIFVAGPIWRERAHARANCLQIEAAAAGGVLVQESRGNKITLLIIPGASSQHRPSPAATAGLRLSERLRAR